MDENMSLAWSKSMKGLLMEKAKMEGCRRLGGDIEKMNTKGKIAIALAVMMVAATTTVPMVMGDEEAVYTVTVLTGQDTTIGPVTGAFGDILRGTHKELTDSFTLTNNGDGDASVDAKFSTSNATVHGMVNATSGIAIPGTAFSLDPDDTGAKTLKATDVDTAIGTVTRGGGTMTCDAILNVPGTQSAKAYSGTIQLTFSNV